MPPAETAARERKPAKPMTPIDAIGKCGKILDQLEPADRARVLAFLAPKAAE